MARRVGFVGVGVMGRPMAECLLKAGYDLTICAHRNRKPVEELEQLGARVVANPAEVAGASEVVITMVPDSPQVEEVALGEEGILHGARAGATLIDMSTISPITTRRVAARLAEGGVGMLDAPVSGGPARAATGSLTIMVGGEEEAYERCKDVLCALGNPIHVGGIGSGEVTKLSNNILIGIIMAANAEALTFGVKAGVKAEKLREVICSATGGNYLLQNWLPNNMLQDSYEMGFALELMHKDLGAALSAAKDLGVPLLETSLAYQLYQAMKGLGRGRMDYSAVSLFYQEAANISIATGEKRATNQ